MKLSTKITGSLLIAAFLTAPLTSLAADQKTPKDNKKTEKTETKSGKKAYPLTTCVVSDEKLGDGGMEPYVFKQDGREVRLCCKSCLKDFKKEPAKYLKKLDEAEKKAPAK